MHTLCALGYHDPNGTRFWVIQRGLKASGIDVIDRITVQKGFLPKMIDLWKQTRPTRCDAFLVTFPGQYVMPLAWILGKMHNVPVVLDAFISLHDTMVTDRHKVRPGSLHAHFLRLVDRVSCMLADAVLLDTPEHAAFFSNTFGVPRKKILVIHVGYRNDILSPSPQPTRAANEPLTVLFYGTFIPLQGIDVILRAMAVLQRVGAPVTLSIVGDGQTAPAMKALAQELKLVNTVFVGSKTLPEIAELQRNAHCGLGIFGVTPKTQRVIPHKAYDVLASGRPLVTGDTPSIRGLLTNGENALLTPVGDHEALAAALRRLAADPALCETLGAAGAKTAESCTPERLVEPLVAWLKHAGRRTE